MRRIVWSAGMMAVLLALATATVVTLRDGAQWLWLPGQAPAAEVPEGSQIRAGGGPAAEPGDEHPRPVEYWTCSMHPSVRSPGPGTCPICGMDLVPVFAAAATPGGAAAPGTVAEAAALERATFTIDPEWQQAIAVTAAPAVRRRLTETFRTVGRVAYDENALVDVNLKLAGWIQKLLVAETGQFVSEGQTLFELYSPDLVSSQREYLLALEYVERVGSGPEAGVAARARALLEATRSRLLLWDLGIEEVERLARTRRVRVALPIVSPATGYVVEKLAVEGMRVNPGMRLYRIADLRRVWILADVYESELPFVRLGQPATVRLPYEPGRVWRAQVDYIYPTLDRSTRTVKVRLVVNNPELLLRPDMYADVILEKRLGPVLAVAREAVLDLGTRRIVFVDLGGGRLQAREVEVGAEVGGFYPVRAGLAEGERVVTSGHFLVDAESKIRGVVPLPLRREGAEAAQEGTG